MNPAVGKDHANLAVRPLVDAIRRTPEGVYMCAPLSRQQAVELLNYIKQLEAQNDQATGQN